jgi:hypothetical protein
MLWTSAEERPVLSVRLLAITSRVRSPKESYGADAQEIEPILEHVVIDRQGPFNPWGLAAGDVSGDNLADLIFGDHNARPASWYERVLAKIGVIDSKPLQSEVVWYDNPLWRKRTIAVGKSFSTDIEVIDVHGDGTTMSFLSQPQTFSGLGTPDWVWTVTDSQQFHGIEVADFDNDGLIDIVARNQSAIGERGDRFFLCLQMAGGLWEKHEVSWPEGEGLRVAQIHWDGFLEVVVNRNCYENSGDRVGKGWTEHIYCNTWDSDHPGMSIADMNGDGRNDIVLARAEKPGSRYHLLWFEAPQDVSSVWQEHIIERKVEAVHH